MLSFFLFSVSCHAVVDALVIGTKVVVVDRASDAKLIVNVLDLKDAVPDPDTSFESLRHAYDLVFLNPADRRRVKYIIRSVFLITQENSKQLNVTFFLRNLNNLPPQDFELYFSLT